jgi:sterol desaturase/sphingolipid hydroxylase (fatty acid hydroxylase superfamily)
MPPAVLELLRTTPYGIAAALLLVQNAVVLALALAVGGWIARRFADRPIAFAPPPGPVTRREWGVAGVAIAINTGITLGGLVLYREGIIRFRDDVGIRAWGDVFVLLVVMDLAMYALHRIAHVGWIFRLLHRLHHDYVSPRPLTLFVLHPVEAFSFGALWLLVLAVYPASWLGMSVYLVLNVVFGTIGHLGVEPLPQGWVRFPFARHLGTATFHAQHHAVPRANFGFYTLVWDRLFKTLDPSYDAEFVRAARGTGNRA